MIVSIVAVITLMPLTAFTTYFKWSDLLIFLGSYSLRVFALTAGYHRYFSHKSFKTNRVFQFLLAFVACTALQGGPLWWASHHRHHHMCSDQEDDVHSPIRDGFWHSHMIWFMYKKNLKARYDLIRDFAKYPELRFLERYWYLSPIVLIAILAFFGGWNAVVWGFCVPAVFVNHVTYSVNSFVHLFGKRRYETQDTSRNNWWISALTFGEGWHNNHHRYAGSVRQGFTWYEFDLTFYILKVLSWFRIVYELRPIPRTILQEGGLA
ncbi:MAG: fatty acid desaturase [Pseudomonadota bacterium]